MVQAREMFSSGCRSRLKKRACLSSLLKHTHAHIYEAVLVSRSFAPGFVDMILGRAIQHKRGLFRWVGDDLFLLQSQDNYYVHEHDFESPCALGC